MQPFQCDLQPEIQQAHRTDYAHSLQNTEEEPIDLETIQTATAAHRRYLLSPAAATLHGKTHGFVLRASPTQAPCNIHAITMHFAAWRGYPACIYAHSNRAWQQSCSHYTSVLLCDVTSHTTVSHHPSLSVFLCDVKSHTALDQVKVIRNSEGWDFLRSNLKPHWNSWDHATPPGALCLPWFLVCCMKFLSEIRSFLPPSRGDIVRRACSPSSQELAVHGSIHLVQRVLQCGCQKSNKNDDYKL